MNMNKTNSGCFVSLDLLDILFQIAFPYTNLRSSRGVYYVLRTLQNIVNIDG